MLESGSVGVGTVGWRVPSAAEVKIRMWGEPRHPIASYTYRSAHVYNRGRARRS